jgi:hypothetical protein
MTFFDSFSHDQTNNSVFINKVHYTQQHDYEYKKIFINMNCEVLQYYVLFKHD